jgi:hypothetical protein
MDARGLQPTLAPFLKRFDDCFAREDTRAHLSVHVNASSSATRDGICSLRFNLNFFRPALQPWKSRNRIAPFH